MCGLVGFYNPAGLANPNCHEIATAMADSIFHRGPDDSGTWIDRPAGIALAHRRLSILDLSPAGHQPMISASGRYVIVFNGEIYNHLDLRKELSSISWRGHSDTETLLASIEAWGVTKALQKSCGMFALAIWDKQERCLKLARDRMGEKPLYYGWQGSTFLFGSELKALRLHPEFKNIIDKDALSLYFQFGYIAAPWSIFKGIHKLEPGTIVRINHSVTSNEALDHTTYWSLRDVLVEGQRTPFAGNLNDAASELERLLLVSIKQQMLADVPVGAFLSGGYDSSAVVALMQSVSSRPVKTFTIGFEDNKFNEAPHARAIAQYLGTDHTELIVTIKEALEVIPNLSRIYDEPFGDSSAVPTLLVSQLARKSVTVSLSGDGGDELLCGYKQYPRLSNTWKNLSRLPIGLRRFASAFIYTGSHKLMDPIGRVLKPTQNDLFHIPLSERFRRASYFFAAKNPVDLHRLYMSCSVEPSILIRDHSTLQHNLGSFEQLPIQRQMMSMDQSLFLPDDLMVKSDRAAMSCSLETRMPILNHHVVEFSNSLPVNLLLNLGRTKAPLKKILQSYIPPNLTDRPKQGFGLPVMQFLRSSSIRTWAESLLDPQKIEQQGFLNSNVISKRWDSMQRHGADWSASIWHVLMFQSWLDQSHSSSIR